MKVKILALLLVLFYGATAQAGKISLYPPFGTPASSLDGLVAVDDSTAKKLSIIKFNGDGGTVLAGNGLFVSVESPFDTLTDLQNSASLVTGKVYVTRGRLSVADGGAGIYFIQSLADFGASPDGFENVTVSGSRVAVNLRPLGHINVKQFGAVLGESGDNGPAINAAAAALRAVIASSEKTPPIVFPYDRYRVDTSLNFTDIRRGSTDSMGFWSIAGNDSVIDCHATGKVCVDALNAQGMRLSDLHIYGDATDIPKIGLQYGRGTSSTASFNGFYNSGTKGSFTQAGAYNVGSESEFHIGCEWGNDYNSATSWAYENDGINVENVQSDYFTVTLASPQAVSNLSHVFIQTRFRKMGGGDAVRFIRASRVTVINGYLAVLNGSGVVIDADGSNIRDYDLDLHMETTGTLNSNFKITAESGITDLTIQGLKWRENLVNSTTAVVESAVDVDISAFDVYLPSATTTPTVFSPASSFTLAGEMNIPHVSLQSGLDVARFDGKITVKDNTTTSLPAAGDYKAFDVSGNPVVLHGTINGIEYNTFTPTITFATPGTLSVSYAAQAADYVYNAKEKLVYFKISLSFDPTLGTASGELRIPLPFTASNRAGAPPTYYTAIVNSNVIWPASSAFISAKLAKGGDYLTLQGIKSGASAVTLDTTNVTPGSNNIIYVSGSYIAN